MSEGKRWVAAVVVLGSAVAYLCAGIYAVASVVGWTVPLLSLPMLAVFVWASFVIIEGGWPWSRKP